MKTKKITVKTVKFFDIICLTDKVKTFLQENNCQNGLINIFTRHTTVAIRINEKEDGFFKDLKRVVFNDIANPEDDYHHNDLETRDPATLCPINGEECLNGHSHVGQMIMGAASETIPVLDGEIQLGRWQEILLWELDHGRDREVIFSFVGE